MFFVNSYAARDLFINALNRGCGRFVYASSTAVYGNLPVPFQESQEPRPLNEYGESKKLLENLVKEVNGKFPEAVFVGLRYCNVYGPREADKGVRSTMIYQLAKQMTQGDPNIFTDGEQKRDYIYLKDVVRANILASHSMESCVVNCGFGKSVSFNRLIQILNSVLGTSRSPVYIENPEPESYQNYTECDMSLALEKIGFKPIFDINAGILDYYRSGALISGTMPTV